MLVGVKGFQIYEKTQNQKKKASSWSKMGEKLSI